MSSTPNDTPPNDAPVFSVIIPSAGLRPRGLAQALESVAAAVAFAAPAGLAPAQVEVLVGFDGRDGFRPAASLADLRYFVLPRPQGKTCGFGNHIRHILMGQARGGHLLLLDDDNALTPEAFAHYLPHLGAEMVIARVDTSRAFPDVPFLPRPAPEGVDPAPDAIRQGNIDPLCLCLSRELAFVRCRGWADEGGYESDFLNIRRYFRRARKTVRLDALVGVYDAGRGLDEGGLNQRQERLSR
jgi:hypothetical protein